jgi:hypothetical protein
MSRLPGSTKKAGGDEALPALKQPIRIAINDPAFPTSLYTKGEGDVLVEIKKSSQELYRISQSISSHIRFLPIVGVELSIEHHDKTRLKDYVSLTDICLRTLYRACVIEDMTSATVHSISVKHVPADKRKIVINITPSNHGQPSASQKVM